MTPSRSVNQTFDSTAFDVPTACLPAFVHCASLPGAPGARLLESCARGTSNAASRREKTRPVLIGDRLFIFMPGLARPGFLTTEAQRARRWHRGFQLSVLPPCPLCLCG